MALEDALTKEEPESLLDWPSRAPAGVASAAAAAPRLYDVGRETPWLPWLPELDRIHPRFANLLLARFGVRLTDTLTAEERLRRLRR